MPNFDEEEEYRKKQLDDLDSNFLSSLGKPDAPVGTMEETVQVPEIPREISSVAPTPTSARGTAAVSSSLLSDTAKRKEVEDAISERLEGAREKKRENTNVANIMDAVGTIGAGLSGQKADSSFYDKLRDQAGTEESQVLTDAENKRKQVAQAIEERRRLAEEDYKKKYLDVLGRKADATTNKLTPGQQALDKAFAKEYDEWTSKDRSIVDRNLDKLEGVRDTLEKRKNDLIAPSGRLVGRLPDWARSQESLRLREDVRGAVMDTLRATLGAAFTEKEGERVFNLAYNENLSPDENLHKLNPLIKQLQTQRDAKDAKGAFFDSQGTLKGFSGAMPRQEKPQTKIVGEKTYVKVPGGWQEQ